MYTSEEVMRGLALLTPPWYSVCMIDEHGTLRYGTSVYETWEEAQRIANALQEAYQCAGYNVAFRVRLRDMEAV